MENKHNQHQQSNHAPPPKMPQEIGEHRGDYPRKPERFNLSYLLQWLRCNKNLSVGAEGGERRRERGEFEVKRNAARGRGIYSVVVGWAGEDRGSECLRLQRWKVFILVVDSPVINSCLQLCFACTTSPSRLDLHVALLTSVSRWKPKPPKNRPRGFS